MHIAVCEDNMDDLENITELIRNVLDERRVEYRVTVFENAEKLLAVLSHSRFNVFFLDIYMKGITGVQAAYEIRKSHPASPIVFTTSSPDYMAEGFDVDAAHYILKPVTKESVSHAIERCLRLVGSLEKYITLTAQRMQRKVLLRDIHVIESFDKYCLFSLESEKLQSYIRLNDVESLLDDKRFLRCHRSFIINMDHTAGIIDNNFKMMNGTLIPVKRDTAIEMKAKFQEYCFEKLRKGN